LFAAVSGEVTLAVAVDVEPAVHDRSVDGVLQMPVRTVLSCQSTFLGMSKFTETSLATRVSLSF
jgi:hypothetical protein